MASDKALVEDRVEETRLDRRSTCYGIPFYFIPLGTTLGAFHLVGLVRDGMHTHASLVFCIGTALCIGFILMGTPEQRYMDINASIGHGNYCISLTNMLLVGHANGLDTSFNMLLLLVVCSRWYKVTVAFHSGVILRTFQAEALSKLTPIVKTPFFCLFVFPKCPMII